MEQKGREMKTFRLVMVSDSGMERKGGLQQRKRKRQEDEELENGPNTSFLAQHLVKQFAWGDISPQEAQNLASLSLKDLRRRCPEDDIPDDLVALASIGQSGRDKQKCYSQLMAKLEPAVKLPQPMEVKMRFKMGDFRQQIMLPHEVFSSLFRSYGPAFRSHILPRPEDLGPFWTKVAGHPALEDHDVLSREDRFTKAIPIGVHGDDCPVSGLGKCWVSKLSTLSWYSFMGTASRTLEKLIWIYSCPEKYRLNKSDECEPTLETFFRILAWSLTWLYRGQWPDKDFNGVKCLWTLHHLFFPCEPPVHHQTISIY